MACEVTKGRRLALCKDGAAGLLTVWFINRPFRVEYDGTVISDIKKENGDPIDLYEWELDNVANNFSETLEAAEDNGTFFQSQTLTLALQTLQDSDFEEIQNLARTRSAVIVQYRNGKPRLAGISRGMDVSGGNESGGDFGDFQGTNLTMVAKENSYAPLLKGYTPVDPFGGLTTPPNVIKGVAV